MSVRLKVVCVEVAQFPDQLAKVRFVAVTSGSDENKSFFKYTPNANLEFNTINASAASEFEPGKSYYVTLEQA